MLRNMKTLLGVVSGVVMAAGLAVPAQAAGIAVPGSVNYVEGQVSLNGTSLNSKSVGSTEVGANQLLETRHGKAEILLTPGVFLRVGDNSAIRMVSPELTNTKVEIAKGRAVLEVTQLLKNNQLVVRDDGAVIFYNRTGRGIIDRNDGLHLVRDGLTADRAQEATDLRDVIGSACRTGTNGLQRGGSLQVSRSSGGRPYEMLVAPLRLQAFALSASVPTASENM